MTGAALLPGLLLLLAGPDAGKLRESVKADEARLRDSPDDADALRAWGWPISRSRSRTGRCPRCASWCAGDPGPETTLLLVRALRLAGEAAEAKSTARRRPSPPSPSDPALHMERALLARSLDDNAGAVRAWTRVTELQPRDATSWFNLAESLQRAARLDEAIAADRKALELDPGLTVAKVNLAKALAEKGLTGEAKELLVAAAQAAPLDPATHYNLGVLLLREGNVPGAIGAFERTLQLEPHSAQAHNNLGSGAGLEGRRRRRPPRVPRRDPRRPPLRRGVVQPRAVVLPDRRQPRPTRPSPARQTINPSASAPYIQLGQLYLKQGKRTQAVAAFQKAIALMAEDRKASRSTEAYRGLAIAYVGLGSSRRPSRCWRGRCASSRRTRAPAPRWPTRTSPWATSTGPSSRRRSACSSSPPARRGSSWRRSTLASG